MVTQPSNDLGLTQLQEMPIETDPNLPPVVSKPYLLLSKHLTFVKEKIKNVLEAGLIERSMSPYAAPTIAVTRKSKPGAPLAEKGDQ